MQQRRGTAAQWISTNSGNGPILNAGEIGYETDTNKFKIGDGTNHWINLDYFIDANSTVNPSFGSSITFEGSTADAHETTLQVTDPTSDRTITLPNASGTVVLADGSGNVTVSGDLTVSGTTTTVNSTQINVTTGLTFEGATANAFETTLQVIDPTADRSISLPDATGEVVLDGNTQTLSNKSISLNTNTVTGTLANFNTAVSDADFASLAGTETLTNKTLTQPKINEDVALTTSATELNYVDGVTSAIQTQLNNKQAIVADVSDTEIGYLNGVTSAIQTQLDGKQATVANVSDVEIGYLDGVTSSIQTQLNGKAASTIVPVVGTTTLVSNTAFSINPGETQYLVGTGKLRYAGFINEFSAGDATLLGNSFPIGTTATLTGTIDDSAVSFTFTVTSGVTNAGDMLILDVTPISAASGSYYISGTSTLTSTTSGKYLTNNGTISSWGTVSKSDVGLANVDNTTDANKPVSTATQTALDLKANLANPTFTGTVNAADITLSGNLTVNGTTTNLNSTNLLIEDKNIVLGDTGTPTDTTADGGGITLKGATDKTFNWVDATDSWTSSEHINLASGKDLKVNGTAVISSTAGGFIFTDGTQTKEGTPSRTPIIQKTDSYTLSALTERDSLIEVAKATATTITIPLNSAVAFPVGTSIDILQTSTGQVTIAGTAGVTVNSTPGLKLRTQWSTATLFKRAENTWVVYGDLTA